MAVNCKLILHVDDSIIMVSDKDPKDKDPKVIEAKWASELNCINNWLIENNLLLHPGKCESKLFTSKCKCKMFQT